MWYICKVVYMKSIKYINMVKISGIIVIEIREVEISELTVLVNNTLVCSKSFLATDTQPWILIKVVFSGVNSQFVVTIYQ